MLSGRDGSEVVADGAIRCARQTRNTTISLLTDCRIHHNRIGLSQYRFIQLTLIELDRPSYREFLKMLFST